MGLPQDRTRTSVRGRVRARVGLGLVMLIGYVGLTD